MPLLIADVLQHITASASAIVMRNSNAPRTVLGAARALDAFARQVRVVLVESLWTVKQTIVIKWYNFRAVIAKMKA